MHCTLFQRCYPSLKGAIIVPFPIISVTVMLHKYTLLKAWGFIVKHIRFSGEVSTHNIYNPVGF